MCFQHSVLKGTEPGDPPIRQADKYEPVIDLETAKELGPTLPPNWSGAISSRGSAARRPGHLRQPRSRPSTKKPGADQIRRSAGDTPALSTNIHYDRRDGEEADERKNGSAK